MTDALPVITPEVIMTEVREWIGTPYQHQGRAKGFACDCLGLVIGVYSNVYNLLPRNPPPYTNTWAEENKM